MRRMILAPVLIRSAVLVLRASQAPSRPAESSAPAEAIRLNNLGVASMNQQKFEQGLQWFEKALAADPTLVVARVNQAIALINLQRYDPARELLVGVTTDDPQNARAWDNLGLLQKSTGEAEASLGSFEKAAAVKPGDAHSHYFVGLMAAQIQKYDDAVRSFARALELDPFLVSAEFGIARSFQRAGKADEAKTHLERFQRLTTEKIASAMSLGYGDQGPLSLAEALVPKGGAAPPAVPVKFDAAAPDVFAGAGGAAGPGNGVATGGCLFDADGDGVNDYLTLNPRSEPGKPEDAAILYRGGAGGTFERAAEADLIITSQPLGCASADYDNDERPDLVISAAGGLTLFHNDGAGRFVNVTAKSGLPETPSPAGAQPLGLTWVDYDHDNDVDLIVPRGDAAALGAASTATGDKTGTAGAPPAAAATGLHMWRNNGNGTFAEVAADRGLAGTAGTVGGGGQGFK